MRIFVIFESRKNGTNCTLKRQAVTRTKRVQNAPNQVDIRGPRLKVGEFHVNLLAPPKLVPCLLAQP